MLARWKIFVGALIAVLLFGAALSTASQHIVHKPVAHVGEGVEAAPAGQASASPSTVGLPIWANYRLIPVWTLAGQPMYVNASVMPVVFFGVSDPAPAERVVAEMSRLPGPHPVALVATGFPKESLSAAEAQGRRVAESALHGASILLLQGSWTTFGRALPTLAYLGHTATDPVVVSFSKSVPLRVLKRAFADTVAGIYQGRVPAATTRGSKKGAKS